MALRLPERIEGPRLLLRRWVPADAAAMSAAVERNLEHLRPWMHWIASEPLPPDQRLELLRDWDRNWTGGGDVGLAIELDGEIVGGTGLHRRGGPGVLEIGYWVDKDHLRMGIATETASLLTTTALGVGAIDAVEIHHDKANVRSEAVPRSLGYRFIGDEPGAHDAPAKIGIDCTWRTTRPEWESAPVTGR
jgi:ribosomal-protein-serine acetyltransferase